MSVLRRLAGLGRRGLRDLARAQAELIRAAWQVTHRPRALKLENRAASGSRGSAGGPSTPEAALPGSVSRGPGAAPEGGTPRTLERGGGCDAPAGRPARATGRGARDLARAEELATAVDRAARRGLFRPRCLARAMALKRLLESRGLDGARVRVGVERRSTGFAAHAWVEYRGAVLGDSSESLSSFTPLPGLDVFPRS